jgi:soluble lytic murein transglycosylase-like protein
MRPDYARPAGTVRPLRGEAREALVQAIQVASEHAGLDPALTVAVARAESSLDPTARSFDGKSVGTFQVTHTTAAEMRRKIARGDVERPPGHDDVALGVGYLGYLHDLFAEPHRLGRGLSTMAIDDAGERRLFAVAAYNAGEGRVAQAQARARDAGLDPTRYANVKPFLPSITRAYVERVRRFSNEEAAVA